MKSLGMGGNAADDGTKHDILEITGVEKEAADVLKKAKELSERVTQAINNYRDAEEHCNEAKTLNEQERILTTLLLILSKQLYLNAFKVQRREQ